MKSYLTAATAEECVKYVPFSEDMYSLTEGKGVQVSANAWHTHTGVD